MIKKIPFLTFLIACTSNTWLPKPISSIKMECFEESGDIPWKYCLNMSENFNPDEVLYYFHGRNGSEKWWNDETYYTAEIVDHWRKLGKRPPLVVSISFGRLWLLVDSDLETGVNPYSFFLNNARPLVELRIDQKPLRRYLVGESMGGYNALLLGLRDTGTFKKVVALCPPIQTVSLFDGYWEIFKFAFSGQASIKNIISMIYISQKFFPNEVIWQRNSPLNLAKKFNSKLGPQIYMSCGIKDGWGCMEGSLQLVSEIEKSGGKIYWHPMTGGHCDVDSKSIAEFLSN